MKAYLITTGSLFTLLAAVHALKTIDERNQLAGDPGRIFETIGIGIVAATLAFWAFKLLRARRQS